MSQTAHPRPEQRIAELRQRIETYLDQCLRNQAAPTGLIEAMRYSLLGPGKRLRPILVLLACEACGGTVDAALGAAAALEMVHAYSLVHDDLPAMDDDDLRRGRPTCHKQFDEATAILVGDALLTLAFEVLSDSVRPAELAAWCCRELAQAAGAAGMVGGQFEDLLWESRPEATLDVLEAIHRKKTGALFRAALRIGGMFGLSARGHSAPWNAEQEPPLLVALDRFAERLGLAFQISDDLLDVQSTQEKTGKRVGKDAQMGKLTYPGFIGIAESRRLLEQVCREAEQHLGAFGPEAAPLRHLVLHVRDRDR
ncbi:MAG: polyprenyl synthetase family protein [Gemmatales bacterium]|nr:polyprenyl synthetase family protein [Gemmatales bacterium]MDW8386627.1 polyprenyl synthetase family protein [Gemmatales bacterium]